MDIQRHSPAAFVKLWFLSQRFPLHFSYQATWLHILSETWLSKHIILPLKARWNTFQSRPVSLSAAAFNSSHVALHPVTASHCFAKLWLSLPCRRPGGDKTERNVVAPQPRKSVKKSSWQKKGDAFTALNLSSHQEIPFQFGSQSSATYTAINCHVALCACLHLCAVFQSEAQLEQLCSLPVSSSLFTDSHTF